MAIRTLILINWYMPLGWSFSCSSTMILSAFYVCSILLFSASLDLTASLMRGNETDRAAMLHFKSQVSRDPFGVLNSWNETVGFCEWYGVTCSSRHQRVTVLDLESLKLVASISPYVGNLSFLRELHLAENQFNLGIPPEIGRLQRLRVLRVQNNSLDGMIPRDLFNCSNLIDIHMGGNQLEGSIPSDIGLLSKLQLFIVHSNSLSGPIPHSVGNLSTLRTLSMARNGLQGAIPDSLTQLKNIENIGLAANSISGTVPPAIFNLSNLVVLDLKANELLRGVLPSDMFSALPNLEHFSVGSNLFSGSIPASLPNASNLKVLDLSSNLFSGPVPCLAKLKRIQIFSLSADLLGSGRVDDLNFLSSLTNASRLRGVGVTENRFGGLLPESIGNLSSSLTFLVVGYNSISGNIPPGIENLFNLDMLDVGNNLISGTIPPGIGKLQKLVILYMNDNKLSGSIPSIIGNLTLLTDFNLGNNMLLGNIPPAIGNLQNLLALELSWNNFTGPVPKEIFTISTLTLGLDLSQNNLTGALPDAVGNLKNLGGLDISENMLSGTIPSTLGGCLMLEILSLAGNNFQGFIPSSLSSLRGLEELDLSRNNLSGKIPSFLERLNLLQSLNLSYNMFEGAVPVDGVFKNASAVALMGNNKLCGGLAELHLPKCILNKLGNRKSNLTQKLAISIASSLLVVTLLTLFIVFCLFKRKTREPSSSSPTYGSLLTVTYNTLLRATDGFSEANLIGLGAFGSVYKGIFMSEGENRVVIAVKVLNLLKRGAIKSFVAECETLRNIRHRNLVKVLTACSGIDNSGNDFKALVFEFMSNGSLENWLHRTGPRGGGGGGGGGEGELEIQKDLTLVQRLDIAIDTASALDYLHGYCEASIIHCDLKPSNILLDSQMVAHIGDFGLAKLVLVSNDQLHTGQSISIGIRGSTGYIPPEYGMGSEVSAMGDVYSYGIILLEMFTGKRPTDEMFDERVNLQDYAERALAGGVEEVADPVILDLGEARDPVTRYNARVLTKDRRRRVRDCLVSVFRIGLACSNEHPMERMAIGQVVAELTSIKKKLVERAGASRY